MAHHITWRIPNHVLEIKLSGPIMAEEVQRIADRSYSSIAHAATSQLVHMIVDARDASVHDKIWNYSRLNLRRHPNNGWTLVIGDSRLTGLVVAIFSKVLNSHIHYSISPEAALKLLCERDTAIAGYMNASR